MRILGISAYYHDSAACLVQDGHIVAAAQEERFSRKKHDDRFPRQAVEYCLRAGGTSVGQLDYVAFYDKPLLKFDRLLETYLSFAPVGFSSFFKAMPEWLKRKLHLRRELRRELDGYRGPLVFPEHHESHAASAFYPSPFAEAAVVTVDGVGEWATTTLGVGRGADLEILTEQHFPHSLGLLYSAFTYYCGFRVNSGEYKLMGLAPYGEPRHVDTILRHLVDLRPDGSLRMDQRYYNYAQGLTMTSPAFHALFGRPPRAPEAPLTALDLDLAASVQVVTERALRGMLTEARRRTGLSNVCLAGGVALNCVANGKLDRERIFDRLWVQPAAGDAGGALGAALLVHHRLAGATRRPGVPDGQQSSLLGPEFSPTEIRSALDAAGAVYEDIPDEAARCAAVAGLLEAGKVVGWFQGRMEFGPRALGARSILGDARSPELQATMNLKIKFRESFRPFAPIVLAECARDWFDLPEGSESPYMLHVAEVLPARRRPTEARAGLEKLYQVRSEIPAVTHVDHSARLQTVDAVRFPLLHRLLTAFEARTGCPVLVNTSFNVRGEPIVGSPQDAWRCFMGTGMDALCIGPFLLRKERQAQALDFDPEAYRNKYPLD